MKGVCGYVNTFHSVLRIKKTRGDVFPVPVEQHFFQKILMIQKLNSSLLYSVAHNIQGDLSSSNAADTGVEERTAPHSSKND